LQTARAWSAWQVKGLWVIRGLVVLTALAFLGGCAGAPSAPPPPQAAVDAPYAFAAWSDREYAYRLSAGDEIALRFLVNPDLNTQVLVGPDGRAVLPLVSSVPVAGLTADEVDQVLTQAYAGVLRRPQVQTLIVSYAGAQIYVGGEVRQPGALQIRGQMRASQAVMAAGGFQETAGVGKVAVLRRRVSDGRIMLRVVDMKATLRGEDGSDVMLMPGDLVFVPRSAISEVNLFVRQFITGALPFSFNYSINRGANY